MNGTSTMRALLLLATLGCVVLPAYAQVDERVNQEAAVIAEPASNEVIDEIVAYGKRSGDPTDADPKYDSFWRQQMQDEIARDRAEEEQQWRGGDLTVTTGANDRMEWGYDPQSDRDRRMDLDLNDRSSDISKPATLFRAKF
jgi:hypothetical protein